MSVRTLETRLETMSVQDENDLGEGTKLYSKTKVRQRLYTDCIYSLGGGSILMSGFR
jgi:hypothetical protein